MDMDASRAASRIALEASAACAACLWSLASCGAQCFGMEDTAEDEEKDEILFSEFGSASRANQRQQHQQHQQQYFDEPLEPLGGDKLIRCLLQVADLDEKNAYTTMGALAVAVGQNPTLIDDELFVMISKISKLKSRQHRH